LSCYLLIGWSCASPCRMTGVRTPSQESWLSKRVCLHRLCRPAATRTAILSSKAQIC
jgi:hypothetical protein